MSRMDVVTFKKNEKTGKIFPVRLGSATEGKEPGTYNLYLDAIPAPENGQYRMAVVHQRERGEAPARSQSSGGSRPTDLDDQIPFGPCF